MAKRNKIQLNLGSGVHLLNGFINIDKTFSLKDLKTKSGVFKNARIDKGAKFIQCDMVKLPFKDNSVDYIECAEAIEHIDIRKVPFVFQEIHRVLKPGCQAVILTTNFADLCRMYLEDCDREDFDMQRFFEISYHIYGNQITDGEYHRVAFSPWYFKRLSDTMGFSNVKVVLHPRNSPVPSLKGFKGRKNQTLVCDFLIATLTK